MSRGNLNQLGRLLIHKVNIGLIFLLGIPIGIPCEFFLYSI